MLGAVANDGPLDSTTLGELKKLLEGSTLTGVKDGTKTALAELDFWNRVIEEDAKLPNGGNGGNGGGQTDPLYDYLALLASLFGGGRRLY